MVSAIGQLLGAAATFLAVFVSLWLAVYGRKPRIKFSVGERVTIGEVQDLRLLVFQVANLGERPVQISGFGWRTGWLRWGPEFLRYQYAIQRIDDGPYGNPPPYELQPGTSKSSKLLIQDVVAASATRAGPPFFARDWPILGRMGTRIEAYAYTATGHSVRVKAEKALRLKLVRSEIDALA